MLQLATLTRHLNLKVFIDLFICLYDNGITTATKILLQKFCFDVGVMSRQ